VSERFFLQTLSALIYLHFKLEYQIMQSSCWLFSISQGLSKNRNCPCRTAS